MATEEEAREIPLEMLDNEVFEVIRQKRAGEYRYSLEALRDEVSLYFDEVERGDGLHKARLQKREDALELAIQCAYEAMIGRRGPVPAHEVWFEEERLKGNKPRRSEQPPASWLRKYSLY